MTAWCHKRSLISGLFFLGYNDLYSVIYLSLHVLSRKSGNYSEGRCFILFLFFLCSSTSPRSEHPRIIDYKKYPPLPRGRKSAKTKRAVCEETNSLNKMLCNNDLTLGWLSQTSSNACG